MEDNNKNEGHKTPPPKLWRPQPLIRDTSDVSNSNPTLALLRHYSLFAAGQQHNSQQQSQWKSSLINSYNSILTSGSSLGKNESKVIDKGEEIKEEKESEDDKIKQKTYPCPECGKVFHAHYNLTRHMPVHTGK